MTKNDFHYVGEGGKKPKTATRRVMPAIDTLMLHQKALNENVVELHKTIGAVLLKFGVNIQMIDEIDTRMPFTRSIDRTSARVKDITTQLLGVLNDPQSPLRTPGEVVQPPQAEIEVLVG